MVTRNLDVASEYNKKQSAKKKHILSHEMHEVEKINKEITNNALNTWKRKR
jgi:hypothetical protein